MTSPQTGPTLLAAREALAAALGAHVPEWRGWPIAGRVTWVCTCREVWDDDYETFRSHQADALLASGVVQTPTKFVAGLAEDEAAVAAIVADQKQAADSWGDALPGAELKMRARTGLRALAAALGAAT